MSLQQRIDTAEHHILIAIGHDRTNHEVRVVCFLFLFHVVKAWFYLGCINERRGSYATASTYFLSAMDFEASAPIVPFSVLPHTLSKR